MSDVDPDQRTITLLYRQQRTLTVRGVGVATLAPDTARFTVGVSEEGWRLSQVQQSVARRTEAVLAVLKRHHIAERDLRTERYSVRPEHDYRDGKTTFKGYSVATTIRVTARN